MWKRGIDEHVSLPSKAETFFFQFSFHRRPALEITKITVWTYQYQLPKKYFEFRLMGCLLLRCVIIGCGLWGVGCVWDLIALD
jgi:hypothetical protein